MEEQKGNGAKPGVEARILELRTFGCYLADALSRSFSKHLSNDVPTVYNENNEDNDDEWIVKPCYTSLLHELLMCPTRSPGNTTNIHARHSMIEMNVDINKSYIHPQVVLLPE